MLDVAKDNLALKFLKFTHTHTEITLKYSQPLVLFKFEGS